MALFVVCVCVPMCWFLGLMSYLSTLNTELPFTPWLSGNLKLMLCFQVMWVYLISLKDPNFEIGTWIFWTRCLKITREKQKKKAKKRNPNFLIVFPHPLLYISNFSKNIPIYCLCWQLRMVHIFFKEVCVN